MGWGEWAVPASVSVARSRSLRDRSSRVPAAMRRRGRSLQISLAIRRRVCRPLSSINHARLCSIASGGQGAPQRVSKHHEGPWSTANTWSGTSVRQYVAGRWSRSARHRRVRRRIWPATCSSPHCVCQNTRIKWQGPRRSAMWHSWSRMPGTAAWRAIAAQAGVYPLVRCDAAKGFAWLGQLGMPTGRGKLYGDPPWRRSTRPVDGEGDRRAHRGHRRSRRTQECSRARRAPDEVGAGLVEQPGR